MKSITSLAVCIAAVSGIAAQPVINATDLTNYLPCEALVAAADKFEPGRPGANKTWDFSNLLWLPAGTNDLMRADDIASRNPLPDATLCLAYTNQPREGIAFWRHNKDQLDCIGQSFDGIGLINMTHNPKTIVTFPYTYKTEIHDDFGKTPTPFSTTYDSFGTLIMPYGTHHKVIRQKIVQNGQTDYIWYNASPFYPILQTNLAKNALGAMMHTELPAPDFTIDNSFWIAEPCPGVYTVSLNGKPGEQLFVYDLSGTLMASAAIHGQPATVNLEHCKAGIYLFCVTDRSGMTMQKLIKSSSGRQQRLTTSICESTAGLAVKPN